MEMPISNSLTATATTRVVDSKNPTLVATWVLPLHSLDTGRHHRGKVLDDDDGKDDGEEVINGDVRDNDVDRILDDFFGRPIKVKHVKSSDLNSKTLKGVVLQYPERLRLTPDSRKPPPSTDEILDAAQNAKDNPDVQTLFFANFPPNFGGAAQKELVKLMESVQAWQAWTSSLCEGTVQRKIDEGELPSTSEGQFARSKYRAQVFDALFRKATWFSKTFDRNMSQKITCKKVDFHLEILTAVLAGFSVPTTVFSQLEAILKTIGNNITLGKQTNQEKQQFWIMLTRFEYQQVSATIQPIVRIISFSIDQKMSHYMSNKVSYTTMDVDIQFNQYQADFVNRIWTQVAEKVDDRLIEAGLGLVEGGTIDVPVEK